MALQGNVRFQIIEEAHYTEQLARLVRDAVLRDDIQRSFDYDLSRNPYECEEVPGTRLRALTIACFPPLTIYFSVNETERIVCLIDAHRFP